MGLFGKKKKYLRNLPPLESDLPEFPTYPESKPLKIEEMRPISPPPAFPEPLRFPEPPRIEPLKLSPIRYEPIPIRKLPVQIKPLPTRNTPEEALYIKVDKYRQAVETIVKIKTKIKEAENTLAELRQLRDKEEREMSSWQDSINIIKEKLLAIDRDLFESK